MGSRKGTRVVSAGLFLVLGLVGAFIASALAGVWDEEPDPSGLQAVDRGLVNPASVRVEVLNGAGVSGLARSATRELRDDGFDVVFFGNAGRFDHARSVAIDRTGDPERARAVAAALGIDSVATAVDSSLMLEVTIVLGEDWPPPVVPETTWSDRLRTILRRDSVPATDPATGAGR